MGRSITLSVRLPEGVFNDLKSVVDDRKLASTYSGYCRQVIIEEIHRVMKTEETATRN